MFLRQGDILFKEVTNVRDQVMDNVRITEPGKELVIAEGEATGHHHILMTEAGSEIIGNKSLFQVKGKAKLVHPEHGTLEFSSGTYMVISEREFDYINEEIKKVQD